MRLLLLLIILMHSAFAQPDSSAGRSLKFSGFADLYYTWDFSQPKTGMLPGFLFSHSLHNEISVNNALVHARYNDGKVRGAIGIHTGTYVQMNYAQEPGLFRLIYEANAGFELVKYVWFDAGVFASHLGYESALSKDNWTLTRSMSAENSPYYETGAKVTFSKKQFFSASALVLNGWQRIKDNNSNKAAGTQLQLKLNTRLVLNSSTFYGSEAPDSVFASRFFHDFWFTYQISARTEVLGLYDIGWQQNRLTSGYDQWDAAVLIFRYKPLQKIRASFRVEYLQDINGVVTGAYRPFFNKGCSVNLDYLPSERVLVRTEGKFYSATQPFYEGRGFSGNQTFILTVSTSVSL